MKKRQGRPKINPRAETVSVNYKMTRGQRRKVQAVAKREGLNASAFVRQWIESL